MANGYVQRDVSRQDYEGMTTDEKLVCVWDVIVNLQKDVTKLKKWATVKIVSGAFAGGAVAIIVLVLLKVKVM